MEKTDAYRTPRKTDLDKFNSVCDIYQDIVHNCTVFPRPTGKFDMHHNATLIFINILSYSYRLP